MELRATRSHIQQVQARAVDLIQIHLPWRDLVLRALQRLPDYFKPISADGVELHFLPQSAAPLPSLLQRLIQRHYQILNCTASWARFRICAIKLRERKERGIISVWKLLVMANDEADDH